MPKKTKPDFAQINCIAFTVGKCSSTIAQSYKLTIMDGQVVKVEEVSRAPNRPVTVISNLIQKLWEVCNSQQAGPFNEVVVNG